MQQGGCSCQLLPPQSRIEATACMRVHIDEPAGPIELTSFHLRGWAADERSVSDIQVSVNNMPCRIFRYCRPDVVKAYPGCETTGFSAFVRLADLHLTDQMDIAIHSGGAELHRRSLRVAPGAVANLADEERSRLHKREWVLSRVICVRCGGCLNTKALCESCGHAHADGGVLDFIPLEFKEPQLEFNGAICSHGYDETVDRIVGQVESADGMALDCGAGWRKSVRRSIVTTDIFPYPTTDVLAVNQRLPFQDEVFDAVLSLHVLEHVPDPFGCARELCRVLKPGGTLLAVTPMIVPEHGFPHHFFNPTREGLALLFRHVDGEARIFVPELGHPINGVRTVLDLYTNSLPAPQREKLLALTVHDLLAHSVADWVKEDIATAMSEDGRMCLAANLSIELVKRG